MHESMTATEAARLAEWLRKQGLSAEEVIECINFIAYGEKKPEKKE